MAVKDLNPTRLRELIHYDPDSGELRWRCAAGPNKKGSLAGGVDHSNGYLRIRIDGLSYMAHRLAWLYMTDEWPKEVIDHKNGNRIDNRFDNLRSVTYQVNCENRRIETMFNASGRLGVCFEPAYKGPWKYRAHIVHNARTIALGRYRTADEASAAYLGAKRILHWGYLPRPGIEEEGHIA